MVEPADISALSREEMSIRGRCLSASLCHPSIGPFVIAPLADDRVQMAHEEFSMLGCLSDSLMDCFSEAIHVTTQAAYVDFQLPHPPCRFPPLAIQ